MFYLLRVLLSSQLLSFKNATLCTTHLVYSHIVSINSINIHVIHILNDVC